RRCRGTVSKELPPGALHELQQTLTNLHEQNLGTAKSAAIDALRDNLIEALRLGFTRQEIWEALREVGYQGSYRYFGTETSPSWDNALKSDLPCPFYTYHRFG